jgi:hypothetical protein
MFIVQVFPKLACILNHTVRRSLWAALDVVQLVKVKKKNSVNHYQDQLSLESSVALIT